jgi:hypothetical protein
MKLYEDDIELRGLLHGFMGSALLPMDRIQDGFHIRKNDVLVSS